MPFLPFGPAADYPAEASVEEGVNYDFGNLTGTFVGGGPGDALEDTSQEILTVVEALEAKLDALTAVQQEAF